MVKFNHWSYSHWGECLIFLWATFTERSPISTILEFRAQTSCASSEDRPQWSPQTAGGRWQNSAFNHLESPVTTCIPSYLPKFCEVMIPCLLKSRQRFLLNDFYLTTFFKLCASYQANCRNRMNCVVFISIITCKYDTISCLVSFTT